MPVVTLTKQNSVTLDTFIAQEAPTTSNPSATQLSVGTGPSANTAKRALLRFDLGLIPNNAIINSATLKLAQNGSYNNRTINIHKILSDWNGATTWNTQPTFEATPSANFDSSTATIYSIDVKSIVQDWVNGTTVNNGILLKMADESELSTVRTFYSFDYATVSNQPQLVIDYTIPSTGKKCVEFVSASPSTSPSTPSNSYSPNLPTGWQQGDLLVAVVQTTAADISTPAGWAGYLNQNGSLARRAMIAYKFADSAESNPVFTASDTGYWLGTVLAFRNVKSVLKVSNANTFTSPTGLIYPPATSTTVEKTLFLVLNTVLGTGSLTPQLSYLELLEDSDPDVGKIHAMQHYMHNDLDQSISEMQSTYGGTVTGFSRVMVLEPKTNNSPTLTLTSPTDNLVLAEGNQLQVEGSVTDADANNNVVIKCQINNGPIRNIGSGVSDGSTPVSFARTLTYRNKRIWDGSTDIVGADLAENTNHTLYVWAEDDQGGISAEVARIFRVIWNRPPAISGQDENLGTISVPPSKTYSVTDPEGHSFTIEEYLDGELLRSFSGVAGQEYTATIPFDKWLRTSLSQHTLKVRATDSAGQYSERIYTFTRTDDRIEFTLNYDDPNIQNFFILDDKPTRILVTLDGTFPEGSTVFVEACNNALDASPTWEDITGPVLSGRGHIFQNATKTAAQWAINIRVTIEKGTATEPVILNGFGGAFD